jgi:aryl-alcohol dehydrogenase-like predicted oxidoreductase
MLRAMKVRRFGRLGWDLGEIGCGMWGAVAWSGGDQDEVRAALQVAVDRGCTFFDTALAYGAGASEALLGDLVRANPGRRLYTATKIPPKSGRWPSRRGFTLEDNYPPAHIEASVHASLAHSGLPRFDLIQLHTWEDDWLRDDRWWTALDGLRRQGLFTGIGLSLNRWEPWNGVAAVRSGLIDAVQVIYNIFDQSPEDQLLPVCAAHDVAVIARVPFDEGTLTGTLTRDTRFPADDWRSTYFVPENLAAAVPRAEALRPLVPPGSSMADLALRFVLGNPTIAAVIPGMRRRAHVEQNVACSDAGPLPPALHSELRRHRWDRLPTDWSQ